ncbi:PH domain-containing protein [Salinicoccus albus]|uniref:PH domain-containing protein n=1 Tax=Salinicoccus albus TaxID=418756 RepID=UPI000371AF0B|nr:PH domain-containing protein [Salinicoccus albus]
MYSPQKLHPVAYLGSLANGIKNLWVPLIIIAINSRDELFSGDISFMYILISLGVLIFAFILIGGFDFLNKYLTRFWIDDGKFTYKDGVITKREKELDINRIQSVDFNEPVFHRIFGAVRLEVLTPGEGIKIDTIKKSQAETIQSIIYDEKENLNTAVEIGDYSKWPREEAETEPVQQSDLLYRMDNKSLILMCMTSGALGAFVAIVFGFLNLIGANFLIENYFEYFEGAVRNAVFGIILSIVVFVAAGYLIGVLILYVKYYKYSLEKRTEDLIIEHGLLEKKQKSVNINRVQNVIIQDSLLRRMIGYYSLNVTITSDSFEQGEVDGTVALLPFIKKDRLYEFIKEIFPNYNVVIPEKTVPVRGYRRYFQIMAALVIVATAAVQYFWLGFAWMIGLALLLLIFASGIYSARNTGYSIEDDEINMMSAGFFKRSHYVIKHEKLIETEWRYNPFLKRAYLGVITLVTAGGLAGSRATLKFIDRKDVDAIWHWSERGQANGEDITESD